MLSWCVVLCVLGVVVPFWRLGAGVAGGLRWWVTAAGLGAASMALALDRPPAPPEVLRPRVAPTGGYVGSAACRSCHAAEHASWHRSYHRTMTQEVRRDTVAAAFERLELVWADQPLVLDWRGDALWVDFVRGGAQPGRVRRPVVQSTGSHHLQVLWYSTGAGRELAPVPLVYQRVEQRWLPLSAVFVLPQEQKEPPEPGAWNQNCHMCHATQVRPRVDIGRCDTEVAELGIACEACHGPGGAHVAANQNPLRRYRQHADAGGDPTIVQPTRLGAARSAQVCGQCHSVNILRQEHAEAWREHGLVYRPGQDLHASNLVVEPAARTAPELARVLRARPGFLADAFWADGEVRLSGREYQGLLGSPCYTRGHGSRQMDCSSCHAMHGGDGPTDATWSDDQLRPGARGNAACVACHPALGTPAGLAAHSHHAADSPGSECMNCHMPHTAFGLMKASRSHRIHSPDVAVELATGRPNACNLCHLDQTLAWTAAALHRWYGRAVPALDAEQREVAAGVRWLLTGDAAVRTLAAWSTAWPAATQTAGTAWLPPVLGRLLDDPYLAVRYQALRGLRQVPDLAPALVGYDFLLPADAAAQFGNRVLAQWQAGAPFPAQPAVLLRPAGVDAERLRQLHAQRNDRPVHIAE